MITDMICKMVAVLVHFHARAVCNSDIYKPHRLSCIVGIGTCDPCDRDRYIRF